MALSTLEKRIEKKVYKRGPDECWPWLGYIHPDGDARIWVDDELGSIGVPAALYLVRDEDIPEGMEVQSCPILRDCCNPRHHRLATREEIADRILWTKGLSRRPPREGRPRRSLSDEQVRQIFLSDEETSVLAKRYNVTDGQVANIRAGRRHREITDPLRSARPSRIRDGRSGDLKDQNPLTERTAN